MSIQQEILTAPVVPLRYLVSLNPRPTSDSDDDAVYLPMEAISEFGPVDTSRRRPFSDLRQGYSYVGDGDIALAKVTPCFENGKGFVARNLPGGYAFATSEVIVMRPSSEVESDYLSWIFQSSPFMRQGESHMTGAGGLRRVPDAFVNSYAIPVPHPRVQRAIANFLDHETTRIAALIEEQQRLNKILRERRAAVLSSAFDTGHETESTKVGRLLAARPSYGVLVPNYVNEGDGVPFVRVGDLLNLTRGRPMLEIAPEQSDEFSRTKIVGGEVLLGVVGKMGQAVLAPRWLAGANVARAVAVLRCKEPAVAPLLCAWLGSSNFLRQAELATSGDSIQPTLGMKDLSQFVINLPTDSNAATHLASRLEKIDRLIAETDRFIELSNERRSALITAAVTGQIDVRGKL